jgi:hypothetical protein
MPFLVPHFIARPRPRPVSVSTLDAMRTSESEPDESRLAEPWSDNSVEPPKRRFLVRAVSCVVVPPALTAYFAWTYAQLLCESRPARDASSPNPDGRYIWWSWFVIGALGLNISNYVLAGVEAGMLASPRFSALGLHQITMHKDKSWSRVSGWVAEGRRLLSPRHRAPSLAWVPLFVLSVLSWAFVLTGLTMATRESFKPGRTNSVRAVQVLGTNSENFNLRSSYRLLDDAFRSWRRGEAPRVPGLGAVYFEPGSASAFNMTTGNSLPSGAAKAVFLGPQADVVVTGRAWGMMLRYTCKTVRKLSDFVVLSRRHNSTTPGYLNNTENLGETARRGEYVDMPPHIFYHVPGEDAATISILLPQSTTQNSVVSLPHMVAEVGLRHGLSSLRGIRRGYAPDSYGGIDDEDVLEFALWFDDELILDASAADNMLILGDDDKPYPADDLILELSGEYHGIDSSDRKSAIGVQCTSSSATGFAQLDGIAGTFRDFERQDARESVWTPGASNTSRWYMVPRFGKAVPVMFLPGVRGDEAFGEWADGTNITAEYEPLSKAVSWMPPSPIDYRYVSTRQTLVQNVSSWDWMTALYASTGKGMDMWERGAGMFYLMNNLPLAAEDIRRALEEAHKHVAVSLMYNRAEVPESAWVETELTAAEPWTELVPGQDSAFQVPPVLVISLLVSWALGCVVLGLAYSFRKRCDAYFSVKSLYWYCRASGLDPTEVMKD